MSISEIREKLVEYVRQADDKKVEAIYTLVEDEIETAEHEIDDALFEELKRRSERFENGTAKTYTWEETRQAAREMRKAKRK